MLTPAQKQIIKTWLNANAQQMNDQEAATALNAALSPVFYVYRSFVPAKEVLTNGFNWLLIDNLSVGKARIWTEVRETFGNNQVDGLDFSNLGCRDAINECWKGTTAMISQRNVIYSHGYRAASVVEKLLATGAGTAPVNDGDGSGPAVSGYEQPLTAQDVADSYNS